MWGCSASRGVKQQCFRSGNSLKHLVIIGLLLLVDGKEYNTSDSVVTEEDPRPRLPGPSIFDYKHEVMFPSSSQIQNSVSSSSSTSTSPEISSEESSDSAKVKRDQAKDQNKNSQQNHQPTYYEMAGDQLYIFEPSSLGAAPFMDSFLAQQVQESQEIHHNDGDGDGDVESHPEGEELSAAPPIEHHHHFMLPGPHSTMIPTPNVVVKVSSHPHPHPQGLSVPVHIPPFNFDSVKIEQVTPRDAVTSSYGRGGGLVSHLASKSPGDWGQGEGQSDRDRDHETEQSDSSPSQDDNENEDRDSGEETIRNDKIGDGECISANEKDGQCVPFHLCYPVVFNTVTGELRNHGLARMLYQASGPCGKGTNESLWTVQTVSVQVQPGLLSNVPLEIPPDFFNHTVCCPGYFYFEENTITPYHFPRGRGQNLGNNGEASDHRHKFTKNKHKHVTPPLKLKLKPSHPDPMLSPEQEGRSFPTQNHHHLHPHPHPQHRHRHQHQQPSRHPLPIHIALPPPPPILLHPHEMFDSDIMPDSYAEPEDSDYNNNDNTNNNGNFYFEESDDDFDSSYYTTARPSSTSSTSTKRPRIRQKIKSTNNPEHPHPQPNTVEDNVLKGLNQDEKRRKKDHNDEDRADGSARSEVNANPPDENVKGGSKNSGNSTTTNKGGTRSKPATKKRRPSGNRSRNNGTSTNKANIPKSEAAVPVVVPPPHLSAWNCPGRQMGMPRGQWPWMVALLNEGSHFCSGSLIDHRSVLTSASCVASFQGKDIGRMRAILGDRVLYSSVDGPHVWRKIVRITRHLQYSPDSMEHDIAILEMETGVTFTPNIQPINLPSTSNKGHTDKAIVSGWSGADLGKRFFSARPTVDAIVEFMEVDECSRKYRGFKGEIPEGVICTKPNSTSCKADLGAPLQMKTGNCWHIIGILSHGLGCGNFPDIYTDTSKYLPWIQRNIRPHFQFEETFLKT